MENKKREARLIEQERKRNSKKENNDQGKM